MHFEKTSSLSQPQLTAVRTFALRHGRNWKSKLNLAWYSGKDDSMPDGWILRQLRNNFGSTWLRGFRLADCPSLVAETQPEAQAVVAHVAAKHHASLSDWVPSQAVEWAYATLQIGSVSMQIGASTGGVISIDGDPYTVDKKKTLTDTTLLEVTLSRKMGKISQQA